MTFAHPQILWLLAALPVLALWRARRGKRAAVLFSSTEVARETARATRSRVGGFVPLVRYVSAACFIVALARPQLHDSQTHVKASGVDMMLAVDLSSSMEALDMDVDGERASRLAALKPVVEDFITRRPGDRIGIVAFAGAPYLVSPATLDHEWLLGNLERLQTGLIQDGTAIGSAIAASASRLRDQDAKSRVVVLLTDGMNNAGAVQPSLAAEAASKQGIKVYTIGVGSTGEAPVPVTDGQGHRRVRMAKVDIDEATLREIAETTGGRYFRAVDTASLADIYAEIDALEKTTRTLDTVEKTEERFAMAALPGAFFLLLELISGFAFGRRIP